MKKLILFLTTIVLLTATACRSNKAVITNIKTIHDTTTVERTIVKRDTIIQAPPASVTNKVPLTDLKNGYKAPTKKDKQASADVEVKNDTLTVECDCDSFAIAAAIYDTKTLTDHKTDIHEVITPPPVKYVPAWIKFFAWTGGIVWAGVLGVLIYSLIKHFK